MVVMLTVSAFWKCNKGKRMAFTTYPLVHQRIQVDWLGYVYKHKNLSVQLLQIAPCIEGVKAIDASYALARIQ